MLDKLFSSVPIVGPLFDTLDEVIDRIVPDKKQAEKIKAEARKLDHEKYMVDAAGRWAAAVEQAKNPNFFVSGARPSGIWLINAALALTILFGFYQEEFRGGASDFVKTLIQGELTAFGVIYGMRGIELWGGKARR